jgi:hypothetical protein
LRRDSLFLENISSSTTKSYKTQNAYGGFWCRVFGKHQKGFLENKLV